MKYLKMDITHIFFDILQLINIINGNNEWTCSVGMVVGRCRVSQKPLTQVCTACSDVYRM